MRRGGVEGGWGEGRREKGGGGREGEGRVRGETRR